MSWFLVLAVAAGAASIAGTDQPGRRPNVLIVMTDDQGFGDFWVTGNPVLKTPNLGAFSRDAVRLTDFHVAPMGSLTRGQLLTGLAALRNRATFVTAGRTFLRPGIDKLPALFSRAGYRTGLFGQWHLGDFYPHRPIDKGIHADNSGYVGQAVGGPTGGHGNVQVEEGGAYEFTLRRWPEWVRVALGEKYEPSRRSSANRPGMKTIGFPTIAAARVEVAGTTTSAAADPKATAVTLTARLPIGHGRLKAWFVDVDGKDLCGAFSVTVKRREEPLGITNGEKK